MDKRTFLKSSTLLGLGSLASFSALSQVVKQVAGHPPREVAKNEDFWETIRKAYQLKPGYINLENGYYNVMPAEVMDRYYAHIREMNLEGARYMRTRQDDDKRMVATRLATLAGCGADELIITRNTTESLDMIISGMNWKQGDEAVMAEQDYGAMLDMFGQVSKRYGVVNKTISLPIDPQNDQEIVDRYAAAITPKTKLLMISHMVNITGQILPVRKICDMAHQKKVPVMVDGAHAFAHIKFKISDLNCDYYGSSLHKWLSAPLGCGILYVNKQNIGKVWPLFADSTKKDTDILRLNHTGTHPVATTLAIMDAINFYTRLGAERKEERLRYLQNYWTSKVRHLPKVVMYTPSQSERACAIANVGIKGMKPADLADKLFNKYHIYTVAIDNAGVQGCRITPNVFTTNADLDALVTAITEISAA